MQSSFIVEKGNLRLSNISTESMLSLLRVRHSKDVVVSECKNGQSLNGLLKLDAWILCRTYSPLTTIGYEIKCNRQDFERDMKWQKYLDLCHQFYFVCPAGMIRETDLPDGVGLVWATKNRLHTKRKAKRVEPDIEKLNRLLIYIVMSRSYIVANMYETERTESTSSQSENRIHTLRERTEHANERKELAFFIKGHVQEIQEQQRRREIDLNSRERSVKDFVDKLVKLGIAWDYKAQNWVPEDMRVRKEIDALEGGRSEIQNHRLTY